MQRTMMELDKSWLAFGDNIEFRIMEDAMLCSLRLLAQPHLETVCSVRYSRERWTTGKPVWYNARWARFLRWLDAKVRLPRPLKILIGMEWWHCNYETERWPEDTLDRIRIQMALLVERGQEPMAICCGPMGADQLQATAWSYEQYRSPIPEPNLCLFGLPIRVIPWMKRDEVMVV